MRNKLLCFCIPLPLLFSPPVWAECPSDKCNDSNEAIYSNTHVRVVDEGAGAEENLSHCIISSRKSLSLHSDHDLYNEIKEKYPKKFKSKKLIKVVLNESTPNCEITFIKLK